MKTRSLLLLLSLVACGGDNVPPPNTSGTPTPAGSGTPTGPTQEPGETKGDAKATPDGQWPFAAAPTEEEKKAQLERLAKDAGPLKSNWEPPGKSERYGHAEAIVAAPYDQVRAKIADFAHYKDLAGPKFKTVRMMEKEKDHTDLYFNLPIMKGIVTLWYVTRFAPPRPAQGGGETVEGNFVKGNIKGMHITFTTRPGPDANKTLMTCDLNLALSIPAPQSAVDEELRDACGDAVNAVRRTLNVP